MSFSHFHNDKTNHKMTQERFTARLGIQLQKKLETLEMDSDSYSLLTALNKDAFLTCKTWLELRININ